MRYCWEFSRLCCPMTWWCEITPFVTLDGTRNEPVFIVNTKRLWNILSSLSKMCGLYWCLPILGNVVWCLLMVQFAMDNHVTGKSGYFMGVMSWDHSISQPPVHPCFARAIELITHPKITLILSFSWGFSSKVAFCSLYTLKFHLHTLSCHYWLNLFLRSVMGGQVGYVDVGVNVQCAP